MSFSLLRHVCQSSQASFSRGLCQFTAVRLNSTSAWDNIIEISEKKGDRGREQTPEEIWKQASAYFKSRNELRPRDAYTGRSMPVYNGDTATAAKSLDRILSQNNVAKDWFTNRRHKPKGEERRRLESLRWRRRFKYEVGKKVELVQQIRRRGA